MLHPVNRPDCIDALWLAVYIQEELLELSLALDPSDIRNLNSIFGTDTVSWPGPGRVRHMPWRRKKRTHKSRPR